MQRTGRSSQRITKAALALVISGAVWTAPVQHARAQSPAPGPAATASTPQVYANLNQLMRGTLYPESNVIFAAQDQNPSDVPRAKDPNMATDPLTSVFGKWEAVENSALAISEVANLLELPGRKCSNGVDVPVKNPDWAKFVQELREAGMKTYAAAQTKNQDQMIDISGVMATACKDCHDRYRDRRKSADRCK
jgi:hypothetical protein